VLGLHAILCRKPAAGARQRQLTSMGGSSKSSVSSATTHDDVLKDMVPQLCKPYGLVLECAPPSPSVAPLRQASVCALAPPSVCIGPPLCVHWPPPLFALAADALCMYCAGGSLWDAIRRVSQKGSWSWDSRLQVQPHVLSCILLHHSPFTIHHSPFTVHRSPFTVHNSPRTACRSRFGGRSSRTLRRG